MADSLGIVTTSGDERGAVETARSGFLDKEYQIAFDQSLERFSSDHATAYALQSIVHEQIYALVFNSRMPIRMQVIDRLMRMQSPFLTRVVSHGKVMLPSRREAYAAIVTKPDGTSLADFLREGKPIPETMILTKFLEPIVPCLQILFENHIVHGSLNPRNVFLGSTGNKIMLSECISSHCGYDQDPVYECLNQTIADPAGKSADDTSIDYYSLGMMLIHMITGQAPLTAAKGNKDMVINMRMERGSYDLAIEPLRDREDITISQRLNQLLKGLLTDNPNDRWQFSEISMWLRKDVIIPPTSKVHKQASSPILFDGKEYFSPKYLAYDIHRKWETARRGIKVSDISRWSNLALKNQTLTDFMEAIEPSNKVSTAMLTDQKLARIIMALDPSGPLRHQYVSTHLSGLGTVLAFGFANGKRESIQSVGTLFHDGLVETWIRIQPNPDYYNVGLLGWNAHRLKQYIRRAAMGFGMERCLYELNHYISCQSPVLESIYNGSLVDVLFGLNQLAQNGAEDKDPVDRHISAFIGAQIGMTDEIQIKTLQSFPYLGRNPQVLMTGLLAVAQNEAKIRSLPELSGWVESRLAALVDGLHSRSIRREIKDEIRKAAKQGSIPHVFRIISSPAIPRRDLFGYREAKKRYHFLREDILSLKNEDNIEKLAYHLGLRVCNTIAHVVLAISIFYALFQTM